jgi:hypothetical protein
LRNFRWIALSAFVAALFFAAIVGGIAYNAGVTHGIEQSGKIVMAPVPPYPYGTYGWHHPWGFGFGPLFAIVLFMMIVRVIFWRGGWHHRYHHHRCEMKETPSEP